MHNHDKPTRDIEKQKGVNSNYLQKRSRVSEGFAIILRANGVAKFDEL
jgi:hypothetical protein